QAAVGQGFLGLARGRYWNMPSRISLVLWNDDGTISLAGGGNDDERFSAAVVSLLQVLGPRLRVCANPGCRKLFVGVRRQAYCRPGCSLTLRVAKYRERHPEKVRTWKRAAYQERQRQKSGERQVRLRV